jgi:hypothetical protein
LTAVTQGAHGKVTFLPDGTVIYTPDPNYNGPDTFTYTVTAGGVTETATVTVTVVAVNDPPVAGPDSFVTLEDTPVTINVVGNDTDIDSDPLRVTAINGTAISPGGPGVAVTGGVVTLLASGELVFTPNADYHGAPSFSYTVADPSGTTSTATVSGTVTSVSDAPVAVADSFVANGDTPVTINLRGNDSDGDGDPITITHINGQPITAGGPGVAVNGGVVRLNAAGDVVFTPNAGFSGTPSFDYTISDPSGLTSTATVSSSVAVSGTPAPLAVADVIATRGNAPVVVDVLRNDLNPAGGSLTISAINGMPIRIGGPGVVVSGGVLTLDATGRLRFTPVPGADLAASGFNYTLLDASGRTSTASVTLLRDPTSPPPAVNPGDTVGRDDGARQPTPPRAEITTIPALHVTASVAAARAEVALDSQALGLPIDAAALAELTNANGGSNNDLIPFDSSDDRTQLVARGRQSSLANLPAAPDTVFVHHAVHHENLTPEHAQFVHRAVAVSQAEAQANALRAGRLNTAAPGVTTLADPFAIGSPERLAAQRASDAQPDNRASAPDADAVTRSTAPQRPADRATAAAVKPTVAPGFSAQLQRNAATFRARR